MASLAVLRDPRRETAMSRHRPPKSAPPKGAPSKSVPSKSAPSKSAPSKSGRPAPAQARDPRPVSAPGGPRRAREGHAASPQGAHLVYGFHAVRAALEARRRPFLALHATEAAAERLGSEIAAARLQPRLVTGEDLSRRLGAQAVHQGILLEAGPLPELDLSEIESRSGLVLVLDQITDPHNVGAILRTAAAFAVDALVTTTRRAPEMSGILAKAASGGADLVPIVEVVNLARALDELGELGYWRIGLDSEGPAPFEATAVSRPLALVLGAEDKGLRRLTRDRCDALARLDMPGAIKSLNVSNACAVALTLARQRLAQVD